MKEFLLTLLESPGKIKGAVIWACRILLSVLASSWLYTKVFGTYTLIKLTDLNVLAEFLLSGRVLICILLFAICNFILFEFLNAISILIFQFFAEKFSKLKGITTAIEAVLIWLLKKHRFINIDAKNDTIELMQKSDQLYDWVVKMPEKETREEMWDFQDSYINDIGHTFFVFTLLYFTILNQVPHTSFIKWVIIIIFFGIFYACATIGTLIELLQNIAPQLSEMIHFAKIEHTVKSTFKNEGWFIHLRELKNGKQYFCFFYANKYVILKFARSKRIVNRTDIQFAIDDARENETLILLFSNKPLQTGCENDIQKFADQIIFTQTATLEEAKEKIIALCKERFPEDKNIFVSDEITAYKK